MYWCAFYLEEWVVVPVIRQGGVRNIGGHAVASITENVSAVRGLSV